MDKPPPTLLDLPTELLIYLTSHLHNIEDFINLSSTCHTLRSSCCRTSRQTLLRLCVAASRIFFRPSPAFMLTACARELGQWARASEANTATFKQECQGGMPGLLDLCLGQAGCGISMERIRELYELRMSTINPVVDLIDKCIGEQWYATPNFWNGGVDDAYTLHSDPPEAFFQLCMYGELFGPAVDEYIITGIVPLYAQPEVRLEFVKYCVPDWACEVCLPRGEPNDYRWALPTGPYSTEGKKGGSRAEEFGDWQEHTHMLSLRHLLESTRFNRAWGAVNRRLGWEEQESRMLGWSADDKVLPQDNDYDPRWDPMTMDRYRHSLWRACFYYSGFTGLKALASSGLAEYGKASTELDEDFAARLEQLRALLMGNSEGPDLKIDGLKVRYNWTAIWPDLMRDLDLLVSGYAGG